MCQSEGTRQIVMLFLPPVVGCLHKKAHMRGGGGAPAPQDPLGYVPAVFNSVIPLVI